MIMQNRLKRKMLIITTLLYINLFSTIRSEPEIKKPKVRIQERIEPLYSTHSDILEYNMYLSRNSQTAIDFKKSMDFTSISSNFSTNCDYIEPPGVVGRHQGKIVYFPEENFEVAKIASSIEGMIFLHKDLRSFTRMVYNRDKGLLKKNLMMNAYLEEREYLRCRDIDDVKEYMFYLCYKYYQVENYVAGRRIEYQIIIQNAASNQIVKNLSFFETWIPNMEMNAVKMKKFDDRILIMLFSQKTPEMGKGKSMKFKSNPRVILIWLNADFEGDGTDFRILNTKMMNLENELIGTNKDNFEIKWVKIKKNQNFFIQYRILHEDYSMGKSFEN